MVEETARRTRKKRVCIHVYIDIMIYSSRSSYFRPINSLTKEQYFRELGLCRVQTATLCCNRICEIIAFGMGFIFFPFNVNSLYNSFSLCGLFYCDDNFHQIFSSRELNV